jgi:hypothetical protein
MSRTRTSSSIFLFCAWAIPSGCDSSRSKSPEAGDSRDSDTGNSTAPVSEAMDPASAVLFTDVTRLAGIDFRFDNGARGEHYLIETMPGGVGWLDYDGDGDLDLWVPNGHETPLDGEKEGEAGDRLYANDGSGRFTDVTRDAGIDERRYSYGVASADFDNDGDPDVLMTNFGRNTLYSNTGSGRFEDVTERAGITSHGFHTSAAWADIDRDGDLDLFIARYLEYSPRISRACIERTERVYCHPRFFRGQTDVLYENLGDGRFADISERSGIALAGPTEGKGLGVLATDLDGDGLVDLYVANDATPNFHWLNLGRGRFRNAAFELGTAVDENGQAQAGMGVEAGDVDGDGRLDICVTNFSLEYNNLYLAQRDGRYADVARRRGLAPSRDKLGFGIVLIDFDLDGELDQFVANGHVDDGVETSRPGVKSQYRQTPDLYRGLAGGRFEPWGENGGDVLRDTFVARGLASADFDGDGDVDLAIATLDRGVILLRNETPTTIPRIVLGLRGTKSSRDAQGAQVLVEIGERRRLYAYGSARSYLSSCDPRIVIALPDRPHADRITVRWPTGTVQSLERVLPGRHLVVEP